MKYLPLVFLLLLLTGCKRNASEKKTSLATEKVTLQWDTIFNGKDLSGWTPKLAGELPGKDSLNTFRVEDGYITVSYENYDVFGNRFGHLFYEKPYSAYYLELDYRFTGDQVNGGEGWAFKNSGVMFHSQSAESMLKDQSFPVSLEGQFLGGNGTDDRPTMNLCTPGTNVYMQDSLYTPHCVNSTSKTFHGEEWVRAGFLVLKDSLVVHYVNGEEVIRYSKPQLGGGMAEDAAEEFRQEGTPLTEGYISVQSESHPIQFKNIRVLDLDPFYGNAEELGKRVEAVLEK